MSRTASAIAMRPAMSASSRAVLQRKCACGQHVVGGATCAGCRKKQASLQRRSDGSAAPDIAPPIVHDVLGSSGRPLDASTRAFFEARFDRDFSSVRVHTDDRAEASARAVNALAYTVGDHLVFARGQYAPSTTAGRKLLAHELTHTLQQPATISSASQDIDVADADTGAEHEADAVSATIDSARPLRTTVGAAGMLQRQTPPPGTGTPTGTRPEDYGITLAVVDHGASGAAAAARGRLEEIYRSLRPANLAVLQSSGVTRVELHIIPYDQKIIDLPEFSHLRGTRTPDGRLWDDVRGAGGSRVGSAIRYAIAEENLSGGRHGHGAAIGLGILGGVGIGAAGAAAGVAIGLRAQGGSSGSGGIVGGILGGVIGAGLGAVGGALLGDVVDRDSGYAQDFLAGHEGSHVIELYALTPPQRTRVDAAYAARRSAGGPWLEPTDYTSSNVHEYFAQCASAFFSHPYLSQYRSSYTPQWLRQNDPDMYQLLVDIFGQPPGMAPERNDMLDMRYRQRAVA